MYLGVDIGGTKILALVMDATGRAVGRGKKKVKGTAPQQVLARAWECTRLALKQAGVRKRAIKAVGLAVPSSVEKGRACFAPALNWRNVEVVHQAREFFPWPVYLGNDVNLGLSAECYLGVAQGQPLVSGVFIGTGVGGAIIHQGTLLQGQGGLAGELGHIIVVPAGRRCGCGNRGCLEAYASKTAVLARLKEAMFREQRPSILREVIQPRTTRITSRQLLTAYQAKDPLVREVLANDLALLGPALATIINILSPYRLVLGGGMIEAFGAPLVAQIRRWTAPFIFGGPKRAGVIVKSKLGDDAVPMGAALLAAHRDRQPRKQ